MTLKTLLVDYQSRMFDAGYQVTPEGVYDVHTEDLVMPYDEYEEYLEQNLATRGHGLLNRLCIGADSDDDDDDEDYGGY